MSEIVGQIFGLTWFVALFVAQLNFVKIQNRIQPPATFVGPIKGWRSHRKILREYRQGLITDQDLREIIKRYFLCLRISFLTLILFLVGVTINSFRAPLP
jgi:hypothetical protein